MAKSKDLFDDSSMSFGEHLEVLRVHLWKAIIGLFICVVVALFFGKPVVAIIRRPLDAALKKYGVQAEDDYTEINLSTYVKSWLGNEAAQEELRKQDEQRQEQEEMVEASDTIVVTLPASQLIDALKSHGFFPEATKSDDSSVDADGDTSTGADRGETDEGNPPADKDAVPANNEPANGDGSDASGRDATTTDENQADQADKDQIQFTLTSPVFRENAEVKKKTERPVTLTVQEPFMTFLKVSFVTGLVMASPWVFYQIWLFVAAGLYPHERKYVYIYLPLSLGLFIGGALFCFFLVFPFVLDFLLGFNRMLGVTPQIRLSEWIGFALMLPLMFGISFQLPVVMLFLERISIFDANSYREKRRMAILVIAVISMLLTPADPISMLLMMFPLVLLYELGILMCGYKAVKSPFEAEQREQGT